MKAISLWQPWASLIADGRKPYETRHWAPPAALIGQRIAIHAARKWNSELAMQATEFGYLRRPPLGAVVATARLVAAHQLTGAVISRGAQRWVATCRTTGIYPLHELVKQVDGSLCIHADQYGDYTGGRWAWALEEVERFDVPIPALGAQGFWEWER